MSAVRAGESAVTVLYKEIARPALFRYCDPEYAHGVVGPLLRKPFPSRVMSSYLDYGKDRLSIELRGKVRIPGPIGLAAGFDKDAEMLKGLAHIFDYLTVGTFLPFPWPGNPERKDGNPRTGRIVRLEDEESMLNCLGFPFGGPGKAIANVAAYTGRVPISVSVAIRPPADGESMDRVIGRFEALVSSVADLKVSMIEPNFASPNTKGLAVFFEPELFNTLAQIVTQHRGLADSVKLLKMPPHTEHETRRRNLNVAEAWIEHGGDGITAINTLPTEDRRLSVGKGGKSGRAIYELMLSNIDDYRNHLGPDPVINACGGIWPENVPDVLLRHKADTVQVLTSFIYEGPGSVRDAKKALIKALDDRGYIDMDSFRRNAFGSAMR